MRYDYRVLNVEESNTLKIFLEKYKDHDRLDLIMELAFPKEVLMTLDNREIEIEINLQPKKLKNKVPIGIMYCDGDHCEVFSKSC